MEFNLTIILGIVAAVVILILTAIIILVFSKKKIVPLSPQEQRIEHDKKFKIRGILNDGINAMLEQDHKRAWYNYDFAKAIYKSLRSKDLGIEKGLEELYRMLPKRGV